MKLSVSTSACARGIAAGDLTQLEFLDHAARTWACDGVVLDARQFPRTDDEYLAQVKKMAADLGLTIAAVSEDGFFGAGDDEMNARLHRASALGAPLLASTLMVETTRPWSEQLERLSEAARLAKRYNVTLCVRNAVGTFAATASDCKRVSKETDSAWLRFGLDPHAFDATSDPEALAERTVLLWFPLEGEPDGERATFRGFVALDSADGNAGPSEIHDAMRRWRIARAKNELNRT